MPSCEDSSFPLRTGRWAGSPLIALFLSNPTLHFNVDGCEHSSESGAGSETRGHAAGSSGVEGLAAPRAQLCPGKQGMTRKEFGVGLESRGFDLGLCSRSCDKPEADPPKIIKWNEITRARDRDDPRGVRPTQGLPEIHPPQPKTRAEI